MPNRNSNSGEAESFYIKKIELPCEDEAGEEAMRSLPPELIKGLSSDQVWLYKTIAEIKFSQRWLTQQIMTHNENTMWLEKKLKNQEEAINTQQEWKDNFTGKWGLIAALATLATTAATGAFFKSLFDSFWKH